VTGGPVDFDEVEYIRDVSGGRTQAFGINLEPSLTKSHLDFHGINTKLSLSDNDVTRNVIFYNAADCSNVLSNGGNTEFVIGYQVSSSLADAFPSADVRGFHSNLSARADDNVFNLYASGDAPNYFDGDVLARRYLKSRVALLCQKLTDGSLANDDFSDQVINPRLSKKQGTAVRNEGQVLAFLNKSPDGWQVGRQDNGQLLGFYNSANTLVGQFAISGGGLISPATSDYRLKTNIVDLPSATTAIKQLRPVNYELTGFEGYVHSGFIAHEVQEQIPVAVTGTKDGTEAIGTLADYDGTELETAVVEPPAEELTYTEEVETNGVATMVTRTRTWTPSGTRPVYQGVDQTKLIPLLTKALQEVMAKNEELETRLAALEGA
jgi:hypothetical protein